MRQLAAIVHVLLAAIAIFGVRWAYIAYVLTAIAALPARTGFRLVTPRCETVPTLAYALYSFTNYAHVVLFGIFFLITLAQFRSKDRRAFAWSFAAVIVMGLIIELEEGATRTGNCRMRDLIPDSAGAIIAVSAFLLVRRLGQLRRSA